MKENFHIIIALIFIVYELAFGLRGLKRRKGFETNSYASRKAEAFTFMITEPWKTKYHWGGIVQLVLLFLAFALQF